MNAHLIDDAPRSQTAMKVLAGLFFAILGLLLTANNLNLLDADRYLRLWPAVIVAAGMIKVTEPHSAAIGIVLLLLGTVLLAFNLGFLRFSIFDLWPLILIVLGLAMMVRAFGFAPNVNVPKNLAVFSAQKVTETSRDYRGGQLTAMLGGYELDLREADIISGPAVLNVFVMWGGIEITVPDNWDVISEATPIMAGIEVKAARSTADPKRTLILRGLVLMGGVEVLSESRRRA